MIKKNIIKVLPDSYKNSKMLTFVANTIKKYKCLFATPNSPWAGIWFSHDKKLLDKMRVEGAVHTMELINEIVKKKYNSILEIKPENKFPLEACGIVVDKIKYNRFLVESKQKSYLLYIPKSDMLYNAANLMAQEHKDHKDYAINDEI